MALLADGARERAEQLLLITERLSAMIAEETRRIETRQPPLDGAEAEEKSRLANAYRLELARIKQDPGLIAEAPKPILDHLKRNTMLLHEALGAHELALNAVKAINEGLVQAMAEEIVRQRNGAANYGASGALKPAGGANSAVLDRSA